MQLVDLPLWWVRLRLRPVMEPHVVGVGVLEPLGQAHELIRHGEAPLSLDQ